MKAKPTGDGKGTPMKGKKAPKGKAKQTSSNGSPKPSAKAKGKAKVSPKKEASPQAASQKPEKAQPKPKAAGKHPNAVGAAEKERLKGSIKTTYSYSFVVPYWSRGAVGLKVPMKGGGGMTQACRVLGVLHSERFDEPCFIVVLDS